MITKPIGGEDNGSNACPSPPVLLSQRTNILKSAIITPIEDLNFEGLK
jgi:hypothetical protein